MTNTLNDAQKKNPAMTDTNFTVVKRDGSFVPFRKERIYRAIEAAFRDTKKVLKIEPLPEDLAEIVLEVTDLVAAQLMIPASKGASLTVEGIQDMVEVTLMTQGHHDVARDYIIYRDQHKALREDSPQSLRIIRKDGNRVRFNPMKIASSIEGAFRRTRRIEGPSTQAIIEAVNLLTQNIVARAVALSKAGQSLHVSLIQDEIECHLMRQGFFDIAKDFILYRASLGEQTLSEQEEKALAEERAQRQFTVALEDQTTRIITESQLRSKLAFACRGLEELVSVEELLESAIANFYEGMKESEVDLANQFSSRAKIEIEPAYSKVASRLLLDVIYRETMQVSSSDPTLEATHHKYFKNYMKQAVELQRVHPSLLEYDLDKLAMAMDLQRDDQFSYLGLQTLYDRYFIHDQQRRLETPQIFWMRVAMGVALCEKDQKNERAIEFYNVLSKFLFISGTPTLFNSGTMTSQLSSCYLSTVMDDLSNIFKVVSDDAQLSKWAGGIGNDWTNVRATGAMIKGTNGKSQGVIPFLKVANDTAVAVNQCFAPETMIYTADGIKPIAEINIGELVLGIKGTYREVTDKFTYNQHGPMVSLKVKHSISSIDVTAGHPFYAICSVPMEQSIDRTLSWLKKGKIKCEWVEAGQLKRGDYIAQVIPKEVVRVEDFEEEDARLYGILLGDGHLSKNASQWGVSGNPESDEHLEFVRSYLIKRGIHFWETGRGDHYVQIHWAAGKGAVRDATTGRIVGSGENTLPFEHEDLYDQQARKHIAPRFSHLPRSQTLALIQGLLETDGNVSRNKEISFTNTSQSLIEGLRYQLLRLGVPTAGAYRVRKNDHVGHRSDGSFAYFNGETCCYDLRIPAVPELAERIQCKPLTKFNWLTFNDHLFTRVKKTQSIDATPLVCDLQVEGAESYMTTAGLAHNGGKRKGAMCAYLETWHLDIEDFLDLRKNTGDDRRRTHDMNTANWIPDLFMKRVQANGMWTLFSPSDVPDLHDLYGAAFEKRYLEYERMVEEGKIKLFKKIEAVQLWRKMLSMLFETGHPWITFKDPSNIRSPQDHAGVVHSSNLCTEILLNTSIDETAVCNLGSINLPEHMTEKGIDEKKLAETIRTAVRMLDNVIDINFYPTPEAERANLRHRAIGLGLMGFQDALYIQNISYASHEAVKFADNSMELISYYAILSSSELAKERGAYSSFKGSKWDRGFLPIDTLDLLEEERGGYVDVDRSSILDWTLVRESIKKYGMRNCNTMAIAPTATISNITGITQSIEPMYKHLFVKSNLSGEFTITNTYLVDRLKKLGLWDAVMLDDLKYFDGSISEIDRIPQELKHLFLTAFEIDPEWIIECASRRQKWIDMGQSLNLYLAEPSGKKLNQMYFLSWTKGLKTNYYLRTLAATQIEKSTTDINARGLQPRWMKHKSASSNILIERDEEQKDEKEDRPKKNPMSCSLGEECESCQ
ncbi:MAG TPA: ribonucleoside-diphosphate reductase subunit alpha [Rhabdochlamydiaceae bacterium]|nr:ribonucleoside-diphosphate reductase subunit alpha [Rhabdochlamydiaceae bacterium]